MYVVVRYETDRYGTRFASDFFGPFELSDASQFREEQNAKSMYGALYELKPLQKAV